MGSVLQEFVERRQLLKDLDFRDDSRRISVLLNWLEDRPEIVPILNDLRREVDAEKLLPKSSGFPRPPNTNTPQEVRAFGLYLMGECRNGDPLNSLAMEINIPPKFGGKRAQDYLDAVVERYIEPFLDFVEAQLEQQLSDNTPDAVAERCFAQIFTPEFQSAFPKTHAAIRSIEQICSPSIQDGAWFHVGTGCREAMNAFVGELRMQGHLDPSWDTTKGNTKGILKQVIAASGEDGRIGDSLASLIAAAWDYASAILHRPHSERSEALRAYLWTALTISEIHEIILGAKNKGKQ